MKHKTLVAVFDSRGENSHAKNVLKLFLEKAPACEIQLFSIYDANGKLDLQRFQKALQELEKTKVQILHLSWNLLFEPQFQIVIQELEKQIKLGRVVIAASGESQELDRINAPIGETVMGQVSGAILVGELDTKGKLTSRAFYGHQVVAAWPAPSGYQGSSFSSILMTAEICKRGASNRDWLPHFRAVRGGSAKTWPPLKDYFE